MQVIHSVTEMQSLAIRLRSQGSLIGFVPTMGALHQGHLSLVEKAREQADVVIVSIFVNPTQFGPNEDFDRYPRRLEADLELCRQQGVDIVFVPEQKEIYPQGFSSYIVEEQLSRGLCGVSRPGHFRGVATIVTILLNITRPDCIVLGQKDAQQAAIIRKVISDLWLPTQVIVAPTMREDDGLAISSRNRYLEGSQRSDAARIYAAMQSGKALVDTGVRTVDRIVAEVTHQLSQSRRIRVIYVAVVDKETMEPCREIVPGKSLLAVAVWLDQVRLIDNIFL